MIILPQSEVVLQYLFLEFINTLLYLSCKQNLSKAWIVSVMLYNYNLDNDILWFTQSNAFSRSQKMPPIINLLFIAFKVSLNNVYLSFSVEECCPKSNCSYAKML